MDTARAAHADMQSHVPETASSSSSDTGAAENLGDVITRLAKEHAKRAQQSSGRAASSCGGGAPPPNDPRNNRNKGKPSQSNSGLKGFGIKLKDEETILKDFGKVRGRRIKGGQLYAHEGLFYHLDTLHSGEIAHLEVYNRRGLHLGEADPMTGRLIPNTADLKKTINIK